VVGYGDHAFHRAQLRCRYRLTISILGVSAPTVVAHHPCSGAVEAGALARVARPSPAQPNRHGLRILGAQDLRIMLLFIALISRSIAFVAVLDVARMMIFRGHPRLPRSHPATDAGFGTIISGLQYLISAWWIATMHSLF
jgi:hypothetical protein